MTWKGGGSGISGVAGTPTSATMVRGDAVWAAPWPGPRSALYVPPLFLAGNVTKANFQQMQLTPLYFSKPSFVDQLLCRVTSPAAAGSGGVVRMGLYAPDEDGYPGALLLDAGVVGAETTGVKAIGIAVQVPAGPVWAVAVTQIATSTLAYATYSSFGPVPPMTQNSDLFIQPAIAQHSTSLGANSAQAVAGALPAGITLGWANNGGAGWSPLVVATVVL